MSDEATDALPSGMVLDKYVIVRPIGAGGMGAIYEATHSELGKRVAIKTLHAEVARNPEVRARFIREGQAATRIRHPHVVDVNDVGVSQGIPYLVMEFLEGEDLANRLARDGALTPELIAEVMLPVMSAVATAHEEGIIHRDLKPENIFLARTRHGTVVPKLLDFGISKVADPVAQGRALTGTNSLLGTPFYMSPEQASGGKNVDARSDQYSLGVILYECATGVKPFRAETLFSLLTSIVQGTFDPPSVARAGLPPSLEAAILRSMRRDPAERFDNVGALARELLPFASVGLRASWEPVFGPAAAAAAPLPARARTGEAVPTPSFFSGSTLAASATELSRSTAAPSRRGWTAGLIGLGVAVVAVIAGVMWTSHARPASSGARSPATAVTPSTPAAPAIAPTNTAPTLPPAPPAVVNADVPAVPTLQTPPPPSTAASEPGTSPSHPARERHGLVRSREPGAHIGVNGSPVFE